MAEGEPKGVIDKSKTGTASEDKGKITGINPGLEAQLRITEVLAALPPEQRGNFLKILDKEGSISSEGDRSNKRINRSLEDLTDEDEQEREAYKYLPPNIAEVGIPAFTKEFNDRLYDLIEKQQTRSFDEDRHLVYPLEMMIRSLWPSKSYRKYKGPDGVYRVKDTSEIIDFEKIRKELTDKLNAYRSCHNGIYLYRDAEQAASLIRVAQYFKENVEAELSRNEEINRAFQKIASILEDDIEDKDVRQKKISDLTSIAGLDKDIPLWAFRMASGLICIYNEAARADISINQAGDFFQNRLFNMGNRAAINWEKMGRDPNPEFCQSLDLRLKTLWQKRIESRLEKLIKETMEAETEVDNLKKRIELEKDENKKKELKNKKEEIEKKIRVSKKDEILRELANKFREYGIELSGLTFTDAEKSNEINFEKYSLKKINLKKISEEDFFQLKNSQDNVKLQYLDLADADGVRKAIFDPTGYLDMPSPSTLVGIEKVMKHLKDKKRAAWFTGVITELVGLYKSNKNWVNGLVNNEAKKFFAGAPVLDEEAIIRLVKSYSPYISEENIDQILIEAIGKNRKDIENEEKIKFIFALLLEALKESFNASLASEGIKMGGSKK